MYNIIPKLKVINEFQTVSLPSNRKLFESFGNSLVPNSMSDSEPIDLHVGVSKINDCQKVLDYDAFAAMNLKPANEE